MCTFSTQNLLPRVGCNIKLFPGHVHGKASRRGITKSQTCTVIRNEVASLRDTNTRGGSIEGEANIVFRIDLGKIGKLTIVGSMFINFHSVTQLQVRDGIPEPSLTEGFPMTNVNIASTKHVPHGHFVCTSIRGRHNSNQVVIRDTQDTLCFGNSQGKTLLSNLGTMGSSQGALVETSNIVSRTLLAWTRRKFRIDWLWSRCSCTHHTKTTKILYSRKSSAEGRRYP
mmetsp:Transcript_25567/g.35997  ORF Transcript_25567/g.35997 Transcript_25567/m.35997 type:complete len:227 (+) Transcript_25567:372-1052(+)